MLAFLDNFITPEWIIYLLLLLSFLLGFHLSRRRLKKQKKQLRFSNDYFQGLNYLLNDQQDKALDIFIQLVETDWETIDTSLALGAIFRRNGEIDKAIKLHQNLLARPSLPQQYKSTVLISLAKDYLQAGWLDRAEGLFNDVIKDDEFTQEAQKYLMSIYEQEQEWKKAINIARLYQNKNDANLATVMAHYYCELSKQVLLQNDLKEAQDLLIQALATDKNCVRASIALADLAITRGRYQKAIRFLRQVEIQNIQLFPLVSEQLIVCYRNTSNMHKALSYFRALEKNHQEISLVSTLTHLINEVYGAQDASQYLSEAVIRKPSLSALNTLLQLQSPENDRRTNLFPVIIDAITEKHHDYQCGRCGYSANTHVWLCPSCHNWSSMIPKII